MDITLRIKDFVICVALMKDHIPVLSVLHSPMTKSIYTAIKGKGAFFSHNISTPHRLVTSPSSSLERLRFLSISAARKFVPHKY